jgi:adenosylcobinamide-phosphate synthase
MDREVALPIGVAPNAALLGGAMVLDAVFADPEYAWHPVRLIGRSLSACERRLRHHGCDGYGGGIALFVMLAGLWAGGISLIAMLLATLAGWLGAAFHLFVLYSLMALGSLLHHGRRIEDALRAGNLPRARDAVAHLVGRDTQPMDAAACRRAAVESLTENLTDAIVTPLFWYVVGGLPLLVLFKVVSTMDSMVGYKTLAYVRFGWCGARLDDVMNYLPARATCLLVAGCAAVLPGYSGTKALRHGFSDHAVLPSPNSGWSEAAAAGALSRRLIGPIWSGGSLVTDVWIGAASDPPLSSGADYDRAATLVAASSLLATMIAMVAVLATV